MTAPTRSLIILARFPRLGKVKTRLAKSLGAETACLVAESFLIDMLRRYSRMQNTQIIINASADDNPDDFQEILEKSWVSKTNVKVLVPKTGSMRGDIHASYEYALQKSTKAVSVPADIPYLGARMIERMFKSLNTYDLVFHPNVDGGTSPHGMKKPHDLFVGTPERSQRHMQEWLARITAQRLAYQMLEPLFDIDTETDLRMFYGWQLLIEQSDDRTRLCPVTLDLLKLTFG